MGEFWLWVARAAIIYSTIRLAYSRGRSPWLWGIASFLLGLLPGPWYLLGMGPMMILLLLGFLQPRPSPGQSRTYSHTSPSCPRCHTPRATQHRYCTNCGWELAKPYQVDDAATQAISQSPPTQTADGVRVTSAGTESTGATQTERSPSLNTVPPLNEPAVPAQESAPAPATPPPAGGATAPGAKGPFRVPTAANLTERGLVLFNQGRFQEAIDQFTKAIALDPKYKSAWAHRAEAYAKLGRRKEAAEDMHRLEAI